MLVLGINPGIGTREGGVFSPQKMEFNTGQEAKPTFCSKWGEVSTCFWFFFFPMDSDFFNRFSFSQRKTETAQLRYQPDPVCHPLGRHVNFHRGFPLIFECHPGPVRCLAAPSKRSNHPGKQPKGFPLPKEAVS
jgi:hypothetical protein